MAPPEPPEPRDERRVTRIEIAPKTIFLVLLAILGVWVAQALWNVVVVILVALIMVGAVLPIVHFFERHGVKRSIALALTSVPKILIGTPVAAMLNALAPATLKLTSITLAASPLAGAFTSAKCTKRASSIPAFFRKSPVFSTAPRPRLTPLVQ